MPALKPVHFPAQTDPAEVAELLRTLDGYQGTFVVAAALRLAPWSSSALVNCVRPAGRISTWRPPPGAMS